MEQHDTASSGSNSNSNKSHPVLAVGNTNHDAASGPASATRAASSGDKTNRPRKAYQVNAEQPPRNARRRYQAHRVDQSKVVAKPEHAPQISKRNHQINQVKRRFSAAETSTIDSTILVFRLKPTDPDFPYELEALDCVLSIPKTGFPDQNGPRLSVQNKEMEMGFRINLENGFNSIVRASPNGTLLSWLNTLDRQLESLLSGKKAETIKIVLNKPAAVTEPVEVPRSREPIQAGRIPVPQRIPDPVYSQTQRDNALEQRHQDTRQLEARLGRQAMYAKSSDGIAYTLPIEPRKKSDLPTALQHVKSARLFVPMLYPLLPCRIALQGVSRDAAQPVEQAFEQKAKENPETSLVGHINYLCTHMHIMAATEINDTISEADVIDIGELELSSADEGTLVQGSLGNASSSSDKGHIVVIPRPPEWNTQTGQATEEVKSSGSEDFDEDDESEVEEDAKTASSAPERGVSIDFPHLELHGIELLELTLLSLTVRCLRCREGMDVDNLHHTERGQPSGRALSCKKCASAISIAFHRQFIHATSSRAGYLDLDNCSVVDMLLSKFALTCAACSTTYGDPGVTAVRGDTVSVTCRKCHNKMNMAILETKFLLVSSSAKLLPTRKTKKPRENLGIRAGEPLPRHGRCSHYRKSYRWFRFGCCAKVYACDRCHDVSESHPNEHANRMICGYCSREQHYRPENCGFCKALLVGKKYTGFWEGGQGTRDKARMSRKDPRKYKRIGS